MGWPEGGTMLAVAEALAQLGSQEPVTLDAIVASLPPGAGDIKDVTFAVATLQQLGLARRAGPGPLLELTARGWTERRAALPVLDDEPFLAPPKKPGPARTVTRTVGYVEVPEPAERTPDERRARFLELLLENPDWSSHRLAKEVGCGQPTAARWKREATGAPVRPVLRPEAPGAPIELEPTVPSFPEQPAPSVVNERTVQLAAGSVTVTLRDIDLFAMDVSDRAFLDQIIELVQSRGAST